MIFGIDVTVSVGSTLNRCGMVYDAIRREAQELVRPYFCQWQGLCATHTEHYGLTDILLPSYFTATDTRS